MSTECVPGCTPTHVSGWRDQLGSDGYWCEGMLPGGGGIAGGRGTRPTAGGGGGASRGDTPRLNATYAHDINNDDQAHQTERDDGHRLLPRVAPVQLPGRAAGTNDAADDWPCPWRPQHLDAMLR